MGWMTETAAGTNLAETKEKVCKNLAIVACDDKRKPLTDLISVVDS